MHLLLALLLCLLPVPAHALAWDARSDADAQAIPKVVTGLEDAWNKGDADAFAAHYAENGSFTNILGKVIFGRAGFVEQHRFIFSTIYKGSRVKLQVIRQASVRPDVAVVDVEAALSGVQRFPPGMQPAADGALHTALQLVLTRESAGWTIVAFHNVVIEPPMPGGPPASKP